MAAKKSKKKGENKIEKTKAILKRVHNDFIDTVFDTLENKVSNKKRWKKLTKKIAKKAKPIQKQQLKFAKEAAAIVKDQIKDDKARFKELTWESETLEDFKKTITENPIADKVEEFKDRIKTKIQDRKNKKKSKQKLTKEKAVSKKTKKKQTAKKDNLKVIKGIGPVLEESLNKLGVTNYTQLASMTEENLSELLKKGGINPKRYDLPGWKIQAALAEKGDFNAVKNFSKK